MALLLPVRDVALGSRVVDSQYLIILASMVLWGISAGSTPVRGKLSVHSRVTLRVRVKVRVGVRASGQGRGRGRGSGSGSGSG